MSNQAETNTKTHSSTTDLDESASRFCQKCSTQALTLMFQSGWMYKFILHMKWVVSIENTRNQNCRGNYLTCLSTRKHIKDRIPWTSAKSMMYTLYDETRKLSLPNSDCLR